MKRVSILAFDGCDLMDLIGPYEVLITANRLAERSGGTPPFEVTTVTVDGSPVTGFGGLGVVPHAASDRACDIALVPGLIDLDAAMGDADLLAAVRDLGRAEVTTSVCTGAFLLHAAGLLDGHPVTTHFEDVPVLRERYPEGEVRDDVRWVDAGDIVTAAGLSSGVAMSLHLVERFAGRELAETTARQIDYVWTESR